MSRIAKKPIEVPKGVEVSLEGSLLKLKGPKGSAEVDVHSSVEVVREDQYLKLQAKNALKQTNALAGTMRSLVGNAVKGVSTGFERKLELVGVGYRAQAQGKILNLTLGFSHPIAYEMPEGVTVETPTQTEIVVKGIDKQKVGQVSAEIRAFRPPEPYKGKGVKYSGEVLIRKEAKKK